MRQLCCPSASHLRQQPSAEILSYDSSGIGMRVARAAAQPGQVGELCRWRERWRFKVKAGGGRAPRADALWKPDPLRDVESARSPLQDISPPTIEHVDSVKDIAAHVRRERWHEVYVHPWSYGEAAHVTEVGASVGAARHAVRIIADWRQTCQSTSVSAEGELVASLFCFSRGGWLL